VNGAPLEWSIAGRVIDEASGNGLAGMRVRAFQLDSVSLLSEEGHVWTNGKGEFRLTRVQGDDVSLEVCDVSGREAFAPKWFHGIRSENSPVELRMGRGESIRGSVSLSDNRALPHDLDVWCISSWKPAADLLESTSPPVSRSKRLDASGSFLFEHLPPGEYDVTIAHGSEALGNVKRVRTGGAEAGIQVVIRGVK